MITTFTISEACDICGCGVGNYYLGLMPQFHKNFIGLRYRNIRFESHLNSRILRTNEYFHTIEFWGRFYPVPKLQVLAFVPYSFNYQTDINNNRKSLQGFNDIMLLANYNVLNKKMKNDDTERRNWKHSLWLGTGLKLPTGKYDYNDQDNSQVANANFQLGSGSWDFVFTAFYNVRYRKFGFNQDVSYKLNTANAKNYRFGNRFSANSNLFFVHQFSKKIALMPHAGVYYELSAKDTRNQSVILETGGTLVASNIGIDVYAFKNFNVGINVQIPLYQYLGNGELQTQTRWNVHWVILF